MAGAMTMTFGQAASVFAHYITEAHGSRTALGDVERRQLDAAVKTFHRIDDALEDINRHAAAAKAAKGEKIKPDTHEKELVSKVRGDDGIEKEPDPAKDSGDAPGETTVDAGGRSV